MADSNVTYERIDELLGLFHQLVAAGDARSASNALSGEEQTALFAYQWINGHLGRGDVVAPVLRVDKRSKGRVILGSAPPSVATHARIYGEDGAVEEVLISDPVKVLDLTMPDSTPIAFVEFRTEHGAPVAIVHRIPPL